LTYYTEIGYNFVMKNLYNALLLKQLYQLKNLGYRYTSEKPFSYDHKHSVQLSDNLQELKKQAQNCHLCSLSKSRTKSVFGEGNKRADILFVGDMPMAQEDQEGRIFLGRGGEMLTLMIEKVLGVSRQEVYITNLLKCHPLHTQSPKPTTLHTCKSYLFKEISIIKPKIVVTLGEMAYHYLTNDTTPLAQIRGREIKQVSYTLIPTYHPNFLLKNPSFKKEVLSDLKKIREFLL